MRMTKKTENKQPRVARRPVVKVPDNRMLRIKLFKFKECIFTGVIVK